MRKEFGQLDGDQRLNDHLALYGLCTGDMVVETGGELHLYGMCAGNIEIKSDGALYLYGMCTGHVVNTGLDQLARFVGLDSADCQRNFR